MKAAIKLYVFYHLHKYVDYKVGREPLALYISGGTELKLISGASALGKDLLAATSYIYCMRIAAIVYIVASITANFFIGSLSSFALAALSFPLLLWLLIRKKKKSDATAAQPSGTPVNNRDGV